jgi:hypothetical protein
MQDSGRQAKVTAGIEATVRSLEVDRVTAEVVSALRLPPATGGFG